MAPRSHFDQDAPGRRWAAAATRALLGALSGLPPRAPSWPPAALAAACDHGELVELAISQRVAGAATKALGPLLAPGPRARLVAQARQEGAD